MYISEIEIFDFRNFKSSKDENGDIRGCKINFIDGFNVIIGHNNSGKSNLLKAFDLVLNYGGTKKLTIDDFNKNVEIADISNMPPKVDISITFTESDDETEFSEDLVTASTWLTKLDSPYSAKLTYSFYLPHRELENYQKEMLLIESDDIERYWLTIKNQFLRKYISKIYCGDPVYKNIVDYDTIKKIDFQFLDAIRDVNRDLFTGRNALLREIIDFFIDYDIKNSKDLEKEEQQKQIAKKRKDFSDEANRLIQNLQTRMKSGKEEMLSYAISTGATFENSKPDFEGHIVDTELYSTLKLIVKYETGITIPATHNGLGYNNLIFISLLLAKMQKDASGEYLGSNSKTFPILAIEEPEAHLHPALQYKFLKFLYETNKGKAKQIFITTHSPSITAAVDLDNIICLNRSESGNLNVAYLGKAFSANDDTSKAYVQRFLDATKSDMLFSKKVVLVEGITEQLLMPVFANYDGKCFEDEHVSIINIGGRYFEHFLKLFDTTRPNTINKKVACITDLDPMFTVNEESKSQKCYPFENNKSIIEFNECSNSIVDDYDEGKHNNIRSFSQQKGVGKTFEYSIAFENVQNDIYIGETISNKEELKKLIQAYNDGKSLDELMTVFSSRGSENERIRTAIKESGINVEEKKKHLIASRYLNSISKGENAYELVQNLRSNLDEGNPVNFSTPQYIRLAIDWICR